MKILIPMAGSGKRFLDAGYTVPKPLIIVEGMPIIEHIVRRFSNDDDFIFGCNEEHLEQAEMSNLLKSLVKNCSIVSMPYKKEGPIYGLKKMIDFIPNDEQAIVNYCDFSWIWDFEDFKNKVKENDCDGAVVCYKGFHPHLLGEAFYATLDSKDLWMKEIREKYSWHKNKMDDWSSSGTYYFKKGAYLKKYLYEIEKRPEWKINGEFYVSQLFQLMKEDGLKIFIYEIPYMLQWGTPEDLEEYIYWSDYFGLEKSKNFYQQKTSIFPMNILIPMAGAGKRFVEAGCNLPKPLINVGNIPMVLRATKNLPFGEKYIFITRNEFITSFRLDQELRKHFSNVEIITVNQITQGQASSALLAKHLINNETPLLIGACDNGMIFDIDKFTNLTSPNSSIDALIFTFRKNPTVRRNPQMYGWVLTEEDKRALQVSVKIPISDNVINDHAVVGTFWFKKGKYFVECAEEMISANDRINNEFYIDNCMNYLIKRKLKVYVFEIDKYICWGTPNDLKIYEYWQRYFNLPNHCEKKVTA